MGGRRAYALARAGETELELPEREIEVYRFAETWRSGDRRGFEIECSSGTYVRALIAGLGDAYCVELRRTGIGAFEVADADADVVVPLARCAPVPAARCHDVPSRRARLATGAPSRSTPHR